MIDKEKIYSKLPVVCQHFACSWMGWRIKRSRFSAGFWNILSEVEKRIDWSKEQMERFRDQRLNEFVIHCFESVPYYQGLFKRLGLKPQSIRSLSDLQALPILTKKQVQDGGADFLSRALPRAELLTAHTSGTTGGGLRFLTTRRAVQEQWAVWWRYRHWHGIPFNSWCAYFGGRSVVPIHVNKPPFWRYNFPLRQILFSGYHMSPQNMKFYVDELRRRKPLWFHGYPSLLSLLASYLLERNEDVGYQVKWITLGAENVLKHQTQIIQEAFGIRPRQHYGMAEAVANFSECEYGVLHVDEDFAAVEFIRDPTTESYKVVGTNFTNPATPLLRYDTGDFATLSERSCPCGRPGRIVSEVDGRQEDYVVLPNGARLGRLDHIFKDLVNIREAQIVQQSLDCLCVRVVKGPMFSSIDENRLLHEFRKRVGCQIHIYIEYVETLERSRAGKLRFVISHLTDGQIGKQPAWRQSTNIISEMN